MRDLLALAVDLATSTTGFLALLLLSYLWLRRRKPLMVRPWSREQIRQANERGGPEDASPLQIAHHRRLGHLHDALTNGSTRRAIRRTSRLGTVTICRTEPVLRARIRLRAHDRALQTLALEADGVPVATVSYALTRLTYPFIIAAEVMFLALAFGASNRTATMTELLIGATAPALALFFLGKGIGKGLMSMLAPAESHADRQAHAIRRSLPLLASVAAATTIVTGMFLLRRGSDSTTAWLLLGIAPVAASAAVAALGPNGPGLALARLGYRRRIEELSLTWSLARLRRTARRWSNTLARARLAIERDVVARGAGEIAWVAQHPSDSALDRLAVDRPESVLELFLAVKPAEVSGAVEAALAVPPTPSHPDWSDPNAQLLLINQQQLDLSAIDCGAIEEHAGSAPMESEVSS